MRLVEIWKWVRRGYICSLGLYYTDLEEDFVVVWNSIVGIGVHCKIFRNNLIFRV